MRELLVVNNIPTPYRTFMFNKMHEIGLKLGIRTTVAFQARRAINRTWKPEDFDLKCPHFFSTGLNPMRNKAKEMFTYRTINTDIIIELMTKDYDWVLMSSFLSISSWITSLLTSRKTKKILWSESHALTPRHSNWLVRRFKRILHQQYTALACPGERAITHILSLTPKMRDKPVLCLPNIIDSVVYSDGCKAYRRKRFEIREELGVRQDDILILGIGHMEYIKGFHFLIDGAAKASGSFQIVLLGDGSIRHMFLQQITDLGLQEKVLLPGNCDIDTVVRYMSVADWFVHPAIFDKSPLVTIEAITAGLPVAISKQTGNSPEVVKENVNGFTFDPTDPSQMVKCIRRMVSTSAKERRKMGTASERLAKERFDADIVVEHFLRGILNL